jgi:hypothetical protein
MTLSVVGWSRISLTPSDASTESNNYDGHLPVSLSNYRNKNSSNDRRGADRVGGRIEV